MLKGKGGWAWGVYYYESSENTRKGKSRTDRSQSEVCAQVDSKAQEDLIFFEELF